MKAAKFLSVLVVAVAAITAVVVTGWIVLAQEGQPSAAEGQLPVAEGQKSTAAYDLAAMPTDSLFQEGKRLKVAGDYVTALPLLQEVARREPDNEPAAILVGVCLEKQGQYPEALQSYLKATGEKSGFRSTALYCAATCYKELGEAAKALELLKLQQECDPIGKWRMKGVALQAEIEGRPPAEIDQIVGREQEAARLYRQARDLTKETQAKSPEPLPLFDQVIDQYPETGAAFSAMFQKAELLWHLDKREDMCAVYEKMQAILKQQPYSEKVRLMLRTMDSRVGWQHAAQLFRELRPALIKREAVPPDRWDRLRVLCEQCWANTDDPGLRIESHLVWLQGLYWQHDDAATLEAANEFFALCEREPSADGHKEPLATAHLVAADALCRLGRFGESLIHLRWLLEMQDQIPNYNDARRAGVQYRHCCVLHWTKAPRQELDREVGILRSRLPGSSYIEAMGDMIAQEAAGHDR